MSENINFSSSDFVEKLIAGDRPSIQLIVESYHSTLINAAYGQKFCNDEIEDVVQATWSAFFQSLPNFQGRSHIRTFLFGIFYNKCKEKWRDNKKYVTVEETDIIVDSSFEHGFWTYEPKAPEDFANSALVIEKIEDCMDGLAPNQRLAFHLKEVIGEKTDEICNILGVSNTNLRVLLYRGKNRLRKCLEGYSITG